MFPLPPSPEPPIPFLPAGRSRIFRFMDSGLVLRLRD